MKTTTINGKLYNVEVATDLCDGCAGQGHTKLCFQLPDCLPENDFIIGESIVFVEAKQPEPKPAPQPGDNSQNGRNTQAPAIRRLNQSYASPAVI